MTEESKTAESIFDIWVNLCIALIFIGILVTVIWVSITFIQWTFDINYEACYQANIMPLACTVHPIRFTIPEILTMQWEWIIAHKVI